MKIETERLAIQPLRIGDRKTMYLVLNDFENSEYRLYDYRPPTELEKIEKLINYWARSGRYFTVSLKNENKAIGFISLDGDEIGFNIKSEYKRKGYGYEALTAFIEYMSQKRRIKHFTAQAALENIPSVKLLKKLGFTVESTEDVLFRDDCPSVQCGNFELYL